MPTHLGIVALLDGAHEQPDRPGQLNTYSTSTVPPSSVPMCSPTTVTHRRQRVAHDVAAQHRRGARPLARAVRTQSRASISSTAARVMRNTTAASPSAMVDRRHQQDDQCGRGSCAKAT